MWRIGHMKRWLIIALSAMALLACSENSEAEAERSERVRLAKLFTVSSIEQDRRLSFPTVVRADEFAELTFLVTGEIRSIDVLESEIVSKGDVIATLDPTDAEARLARARAEFGTAKADYDRAETLIKTNTIAHGDLDQRRARMEVRLAELQLAEKVLRDHVIRAPYDGRVSRVFVRPYQVVHPTTPVLLLQSVDLEVVFNLPGSLVAQVSDLAAVKVTVTLDVAPDTAIPATFKEISGEADSSTQTYKTSLRFSFPPGVRILPGMTGQIDFVMPRKGPLDLSLVVPLSAIVSEPARTYAWRVDPQSMMLSAVDVVIGAPLGDNVEILSGLDAGDLIVATGAQYFKEGMTVRQWPSN